MRRLIVILLASLFLLVVTFTLAGCDFVSYVPQETVENTEELDALKETYIARLTETYLEEYYLTEDARSIRILLMDAGLEINECRSSEEVEAAYAKHIVRLETVMPIIDRLLYTIQTYADPALYRAGERAQLEAYMARYAEILAGMDDATSALAVVAEFKTLVYGLKTNADYVKEEFIATREVYVSKLGAELATVAYRDAERVLVRELVNTYKEKMTAAEDEAALLSLQEEYRLALSKIKTHEQLTNEGLTSDHAAIISRMYALVNGGHLSTSVVWNYRSLVATQESAFSQATNRREVLLESLRLEQELALACMDAAGESATLVGALATSVGDYMKHIYYEWSYREEEKAEITALLADYTARASSAADRGTLLQVQDAYVAALGAIPTADEAWAADDTDFTETIETLWGADGLDAPETLVEAEDFYQLAEIIDYYAFHQKDGTSFYRNKFRVLIRFEHETAQEDINRVFWHCELIRSVVGLTGYYENFTDYLVVELVAYDIGSISNKVEGDSVDRYDNLVTWGTAGTTGEARAEDYDDFAYTKNTKVIKNIWNTQQLWYALQYEYYPVCVPGSVAEQTLLRAKEILRQIVTDEMTEGEKIHHIFRWFCENVKYDSAFTEYMHPEDREHFPDSEVALLRSFYAEGALLEQLSVCSGFAKSCMLLLRMEGIEAYRLLITFQIEDNVINNHNYNWYGSHEVVMIKTESGKVMISDPEQCYIRSDEYLQKLHQILVPRSLMATYEWSSTRLFPDVEYSMEFTDLYEHLYYGETQVLITSEEQVTRILDDFAAEERSEVQVSLFSIGYDGVDIKEMLNADGRFEYRELALEKDGLAFKEYIIFK